MRISDWSSDVCSSDLHRLVGELAQRHLTPAADAEVARLLAGEKDPTLDDVAAWADTLRNEDPPRFPATTKWHSVNTAPDGTSRYVLARDCPAGNSEVGPTAKQLGIISHMVRVETALPHTQQAHREASE